MQIPTLFIHPMLPIRLWTMTDTQGVSISPDSRLCNGYTKKPGNTGQCPRGFVVIKQQLISSSISLKKSVLPRYSEGTFINSWFQKVGTLWNINKTQMQSFANYLRLFQFYEVFQSPCSNILSTVMRNFSNKYLLWNPQLQIVWNMPVLHVQIKHVHKKQLSLMKLMSS